MPREPYRFAAVLRDVVSELPELDLTDLPTARASMHATNAAKPVDTTGLVIEELRIPGLESHDPDVLVRVVRPESRSDDMPVVLHAHGGGFVLGDLENSHARMCRLARELRIAVVSVDYRLAPESRFPAALRDVVAALAWVDAQSGLLGVDQDRVALYGISAGAGLAAATAIFARDHAIGRPCFQFLAIPELDDRMRSGSMRDFTDTPVWDRRKSEMSWDAYLGEGRRGAPDVEVYAAPARLVDASGLPPAYISVMEFDPLRDEGMAYAQLLLGAGVPVELHLFPGTFHGSSNVLDAPVTGREMAEEIEVLRVALGVAP